MLLGVTSSLVMARLGEYHQQGPSPWVPAIILSAILLVATTYQSAPAPVMKCHSVAHYTPRKKAAPFIPAIVWVPLGIFLWFQLYVGNSRSPLYHRLGASERRIGASSGPGGPFIHYNIHHARNPNNQPGTISLLLDYGAHWIIILLGVWLYVSFGGESSEEPATVTITRQCSSPPRKW